MSLIKVDIKRVIRSYRIYFTLVLTILLAILGILQARNNVAFAYEPIGGINLFIIGFMRGTPISIMIPFLSMIVYSDSLYLDFKTGAIKSIIGRISLSNYFNQRIIAAIVMGGFSIAFALILGLIVLCIYDPTPSPFIFSTSVPILSGIYNKSMLGALLMYIINGFFCGAAYSLFTMCLLAYTRKRVFSYLFPIVANIISNFLTFSSNIINFKLLNKIGYLLSFDLYAMDSSNLIQIILRYSIFMIVSLILISLFAKDYLKGGN